MGTMFGCCSAPTASTSLRNRSSVRAHPGAPNATILIATKRCGRSCWALYTIPLPLCLTPEPHPAASQHLEQLILIEAVGEGHDLEGRRPFRGRGRTGAPGRRIVQVAAQADDEAVGVQPETPQQAQAGRAGGDV